jgi:6-phosphogluconate dehydrogenase
MNLTKKKFRRFKMDNNTSFQKCDIGIVGLGVMGENLLLNMSDNGFTVAGFDNNTEKVAQINKANNGKGQYCTTNLEDFIKFLKKPRAILLLVPAGKAVDAVINEVSPFITQGDLIIDAGNSFYKTTETRLENLKAKGILFLGMGVSGGEEGARHGPSLMPGGSEQGYQRVRPILEAVAAKVNDEPCVTYLGPGACGHFVKMVHNGIEYGLMELIAESYDLMKRGLGLTYDEMSNIYCEWNKGVLNSYLIEITCEILKKNDNDTGQKLIEKVLDAARQKGTGMWTSEAAFELKIPVPDIDLAVTMRELSDFVELRQEISKLYEFNHDFKTAHKDIITRLYNALYVAYIITYAQGMSLLRQASHTYNYQLNLENVARIWRGGCIIRSTLLNDIQAAFHAQPDLANLLLDNNLADQIKRYQQHLRQIVCTASKNGIPIPGFMVTLAYLDALRSKRLPANLIQAQRDLFGAHTYERIDRAGIYHTDWK